MPVTQDAVVPELFDVFLVSQVAAGTGLAATVGVDYVEIEPGKTSETHYHRASDSIIFVVAGAATAVVGGTPYAVRPGARIVVPKGVTHGFVTGPEKLSFVSVQVPPILDRARHTFDRVVVG